MLLNRCVSNTTNVFSYPVVEINNLSVRPAFEVIECQTTKLRNTGFFLSLYISSKHPAWSLEKTRLEPNAGLCHMMQQVGYEA